MNSHLLIRKFSPILFVYVFIHSKFSSEDEEFSSPFFPTKTKAAKKIDLSDTFSIQEMTIESDESDGESGDSQNLELLPPSVRIKFIDKLVNYFCCAPSSEPWIIYKRSLSYAKFIATILIERLLKYYRFWTSSK